jgi:Phytanoyl-CoA dioxygenase (PhyH)
MPLTDLEVQARVDELYATGIVGCRGAFGRAWAESMRADIDRVFQVAIQRDGGAVPRGPNRYYVEMHPEELRGFVALVSHPWVRSLCEAVLGPEYEIVEIGFDVPFPGAELQPWHRDFPSTPETFRDRRLTSLAFNLAAVDTAPEMGAFEVALGTHWEEGASWPDGMFPPPSEWARYESLRAAKLPQLGDISARTALAIHRGTPNLSREARPVLVLGVDAPGAGHAALHDMMMTPAFYATVPPEVRRRLSARVVDALVPIVQRHQIGGLLTPAYR